jgi:hypothetical protein
VKDFAGIVVYQGKRLVTRLALKEFVETGKNAKERERGMWKEGESVGDNKPEHKK